MGFSLFFEFITNDKKINLDFKLSPVSLHTLLLLFTSFFTVSLKLEAIVPFFLINPWSSVLDDLAVGAISQ